MLTDWDPIVTLEKQDLEIDKSWLFVTDIDAGYTTLRLQAEGEWKCLGAGHPTSGPDGLPELSLPHPQLVMPEWPAGLLIGKLGGSSAMKGTDDKVFAIGSDCVVPYADKKRTILFIAVNGAKPTVGYKLKKLKLDVFGSMDG